MWPVNNKETDEGEFLSLQQRFELFSVGSKKAGRTDHSILNFLG